MNPTIAALAHSIQVAEDEAAAKNLRDQFAMAALQSPQLARVGESFTYGETARAAYALADAMLEARNANR